MKTKDKSAFKEHIQRIKVAKDTASLLEQMEIAEKSMGILWEDLFDQICNKENDLGNIKDLTNILNKLLQNYRQLFSLSKGLSQPKDEVQAWELSENTLREIEEQLQLL